jgi:hypothetical protein
MGYDDAVEYLRAGLSPAQIAERLGLSFEAVRQHLLHQVGEGSIRRSDILFAMPDKLRAVCEDLREQGISNEIDLDSPVVRQLLEEHGISPEEMRLYVALRDQGAYRGDMYENVADIEILLHDFVKKTLVDVFGDGEHGWWRQGIPQSIRLDCASARECDSHPVEDPFCYTNFIHLSKIIETNWKHFREVLPGSLASDRKALLADLARLNNIRNAVMHPIKGRRWTEDDFAFVRGFRGKIA